MLKKLIFSCIAVLSLMSMANAQTKEQNDPNATRILDKVSKKYDGYSALDIDFSLIVELPGAKKDIQKGKVSQAKENYRLAMDQQTIISDGKTNWIYLKKNNEVQILDANPKDEGSLLTPKQILQQYKSGQYVYSVVDRVTEAGVVLTQIEFKPVNKSSEYSKIRLSLNEKNNLISSVKAFAKDGGRYTFAINKHTPNAKFPSGHFTFDKAKFPNARIEDLRM